MHPIIILISQLIYAKIYVIHNLYRMPSIIHVIAKMDILLNQLTAYKFVVMEFSLIINVMMVI